MADNVSILEIDIKDEKFRAFYNLYQKYDKQIKATPENWKRLAGEINNAAKNLDKFDDKAKDSAAALERGAKASKAIASNVKEIAGGLLKFTGITAALGLVSSIVGGLTLGTLARSAADNQNQARALGISGGEYRAFTQDFGRYGGANLLNIASNAQSTLGLRGYLQSATGLSQEQIQNMNPADLSLILMQKAAQRYNSTPQNRRSAEQVSAWDFGKLGIDYNTIRSLGAAAEGGDLQQNINSYGVDKRAFSVSDRTANGYQNTLQSGERMINTISTFMQNKLAGLNPEIGKLMNVFTQDIKILVNNILTKQNLERIENGLTKFANFIGSPEFEEDLGKIVAGLGKLAGILGWMFGLNDKDEQKTSDKVTNLLKNSSPEQLAAMYSTGNAGNADIAAAMNGTVAQNKPQPAHALLIPKQKLNVTMTWHDASGNHTLTQTRVASH